jgi:predicted transcriptional regulator
MAEAAAGKAPAPEFLRMTTDVVAAYLRNNPLPSSQIADIINAVYRSLRTLERRGELSEEVAKPAVSVRKSIHPEYLVCLEDGKKLKMLKRHLRSSYNLSPDQYRQKWGLPPDYPMVAPNYAEQRSAFAKKIGLGRTSTRREAKRGAAAKK